MTQRSQVVQMVPGAAGGWSWKSWPWVLALRQERGLQTKRAVERVPQQSKEESTGARDLS